MIGLRKIKKRKTASTFAYLTILPAVLLIIGLGIFPLIYTIYISTHSLHADLSIGHYIGLQNYWKIITDKAFIHSLSLTIYFALISIVVQMILGLAVSMLLNQKFKGRGFMRAIVLIPWAVPTIVNANLWGFIYNGNYGLLNRILYAFNLIEKPVTWLGSARLAMNMIILADTWRMLPLYVIMILAALQTIPSSAIEAAEIDGASPFQKFLSIILPMLKPILLVVLILRTIQAFKVFDIIYVLTYGGPSNGTMVVSFYSYYQMFRFLKFDYGSAVAIVVAVITLVITGLYIKLLKTNDD